MIEVATRARHLHLLQKLQAGRTLTAVETRELAKLEKTKQRKAKNKKNTATLAAEQIIKTQKKAAAYANTTVRTIRRWLREGMPVTEEGHYIRGMLDIYRLNKGREQTETKIKGESADADYKHAKAKLIGMELQLKTGELVRKADYDRRDVSRIRVIKRGINAMCRKIVAGVPVRYRRSVQKIAEREARHLIEGFAK